MEALLQQYGDDDDDGAHDGDSPRRCLVELSRVPASASGHPLTTPELSSLFESTAFGETLGLRRIP